MVIDFVAQSTLGLSCRAELWWQINNPIAHGDLVPEEFYILYQLDREPF